MQGLAFCAFVPLAAAAPLLAAHSPAVDDLDQRELAYWKGRMATAATLRETLGQGALDVLVAWSPWAEAQGYDAHIEPQGRVVLYLPDDARGAGKELERVERTADAVEELLFGPPKSRADGVPPRPFVDAPAVMIHTRDEGEYRVLLEHAATLEPSLASWVPYGQTLTGFTLVKPLASGWAAKAAQRVEWKAENEVVHRLTSLLLLRQYGEVPYWLLAGTSWHVELEQCKDIYCFPYRDEFVWATEHTAWPKELKALFRDGRSEFVSGLCAWKRRTFDAARSKEAFGLARFAAAREGALAKLLADFSELRRTDGVRHFEDGTWELILGWEPDIDQSRAILRRHLGDTFEADAIAEFIGKAPKAKRR